MVDENIHLEFMMRRAIPFTLNGETVELDVDERRRLLWVLRTELELTGTKYGCGKGHCGSCTVLVDGKAERSCRLPMRRIEGKEITTIEGLSKGGEPHPLQKAFAENGALQCGFCTPGMVVSAAGILNRKSTPSRGDIIKGMEGNFCRCGTQIRIIEAIESAAVEMKEAR